MLRRFFVILLSALFLSGCTTHNSKEEIVFSSWGSISEVNILQNVIADFEKENPDIKINFIHVPQNYFQKMHLLFASNTAPDVIFINNLYLPVYKSKLEDLTDLVSEDEYYSQAIEGLTADGKLLGVPRDVSNLVFYVNKDILDKNGIRIPNEHWSLDMLPSIAKKLSKNGIFGVSYEEDLYWALPYLNYFGGGIFSPQGDVIINSEKSKKGIEFYKNLKLQGFAPTKAQVGSSTLAQMFIDGRIAFYLSGRWMYPKITEKADFNWLVINFPYGENDLSCDSSGWAISKNSRHKDAAKRFVKYLASKENIDSFAKTGLIVPARIDSSLNLMNDSHNEKVFLKVIKQSSKTPVNKDYKRVIDELNNKIDF